MGGGARLASIAGGVTLRADLALRAAIAWANTVRRRALAFSALVCYSFSGPLRSRKRHELAAAKERK